MTKDFLLQDKPHEECGVFGFYSTENKDISKLIYYGLNALQHRGQESAGIAVCDTYGPKGIRNHKGMGLVNEVFHQEVLENLKGNMGVGHVRYSTTGGSVLENAQPFVLNYLKGTLALVHNGNITNAAKIREDLENDGAVFSGTSDSEIIAFKIAKNRLRMNTIEEAVLEVAKELKGGYAILVMSPRKIVGIRDPLGIKPLCLGKRKDGYVLASESCALTSIDAEYVRDIEPGEIITINKKKDPNDSDKIPERIELEIKSEKALVSNKKAHCIFEYIYFARLDSVMDGQSIYDARIEGGRALAKRYPVEADIVTGVPDSGLTAAVGYSQEAGIPFIPAFQKNSYIGRTFIKPSQEEREEAVHLKLSVLASVVKDKRIVLIDDSIVRGTTMAKLIDMLRAAGAKEVHVRISSPPFLYPCYYGTDIPNNSQLIASQHSTEEIRQRIGADSLGYMSIEDLPSMSGNLPICKACFDNNYPT